MGNDQQSTRNGQASGCKSESIDLGGIAPGKLIRLVTSTGVYLAVATEKTMVRDREVTGLQVEPAGQSRTSKGRNRDATLTRHLSRDSSLGVGYGTLREVWVDGHRVLPPADTQ